VLRVVVGQYEPGDLLGHVHEQLVPVRLGEVARLNFAVQHDLDVDFVVGGVHPGRVVDEVGVDPTSQAGELDTGGLGHTQVAALTHDLGTQLGRADTHLVVGLVTDLGVGLRGGLDVGSDTAVPHQVHRGAQDPADELVRAQLRDFVLDTEHFTYLRGHRYRLGGARVHATTLGDQFLVVVLPGAAGQVVQAITLGPGGLRVRVGVQEDVTVVEGRHEFDLLGPQHAVAEDVTGHVTDADGGERLFLRVHPHFAEVVLDRLPGTACGDAHRLVVVADRPPGRKGVTQPEVVLFGDRVGDVGEGRGALVRGDHPVGVFPIVADGAFGVDDPAVDEVVGDVEQAADELLVAGHDLLHHLFTSPTLGQSLADEPALGAAGNDDGVLHHLCLDQAEDLRSEVLEAVGP